MPYRDKSIPIDDVIRERLNRGILLRTGAYRTDDHIVLRSGRHTSEYVAKTLVTTEPTFTEGLGDIIATHFSRSPVDLVLTTGYSAGLLGHCVARAHPGAPSIHLRHQGEARRQPDGGLPPPRVSGLLRRRRPRAHHRGHSDHRRNRSATHPAGGEHGGAGGRHRGDLAPEPWDAVQVSRVHRSSRRMSRRMRHPNAPCVDRGSRSIER